VEIESRLVSKFRRRIEKKKKDIGGQVTVVEGDLRSVDLSPATIIYLYLLPEALSLIEPVLIPFLSSSHHCRLVCNTWGPPTLIPKEKRTVGRMGNTTLRLYDYTSVTPTGGELQEEEGRPG